MKKNTIDILLLLSVCFALYGCGTKGPLYIPEQQYPQDTPVSK
jgi:predicted small lipoprotein YifL